MLAAEHHLTFCMGCQWRYAAEQAFRAALRQSASREHAPAELEAGVRRALQRVDRGRQFQGALRWLAAPLAAAALAVLILGGPSLRLQPQPSPLLADLVGKHLLFSRLEAPAEIATSDRQAVAGWFGRRVRFEVPVPDFTPSGIRLLGGRLSELEDQEAAYLLYEKGRTLISLFAFMRQGRILPDGERVSYGGHSFLISQLRGAEVVLWTDREMAFALVSTLPRDALLECAATVLRERLSAPAGRT
jgi:anti-sigma factor RsiW